MLYDTCKQAKIEQYEITWLQTLLNTTRMLTINVSISNQMIFKLKIWVLDSEQ